MNLYSKMFQSNTYKFILNVIIYPYSRHASNYRVNISRFGLEFCSSILGNSLNKYMNSSKVVRSYKAITN